MFSALIQCISQGKSLLGGTVFKWEYPCISVEVVTCREEVVVEGLGSLCLSCCPVVAEAVSKGLEVWPTYISEHLQQMMQ